MSDDEHVDTEEEYPDMSLSEEEYYALFHACSNNDTEKFLKLAPRASSDVFITDDPYLSERMVYMACTWGNADILRYLLKRPNVVDDIDFGTWKHSDTPIHAACHEDATCLKMLLEYSRPASLVHLRDGDGYTPLHRCCEHGYIECIKVLLSQPNVIVSTKVTNHCCSSDYGLTAYELFKKYQSTNPNITLLDKRRILKDLRRHSLRNSYFIKHRSDFLL